MSAHFDPVLKDALLKTAPGTELREGLERILRGRTGALIVLGHGKRVDAIASGGFQIDTAYSAARLRELAKMDGAIVLSHDGTTIRSAAVQLTPDAQIEARESGTRHRTAERTSVDTGYPVITVSASMNIIALFINGQRYMLDRTELVLERANQALNTLGRYRERLDQVMNALSLREVEDTVTVQEVAIALQRQEMVRRIVQEISTYAIELGAEGRLVTLQLEELAMGIEGNSALLLRDYESLRIAAAESGELGSGFEYFGDASLTEAEILERQLQVLAALTNEELVDLGTVAQVLGVDTRRQSLEQAVAPTGHRILNMIRNIPGAIADRILEHFGDLQALLAASSDELRAVDGVGDQRARAVREGLGRLVEVNFYDRG